MFMDIKSLNSGYRAVGSEYGIIYFPLCTCPLSPVVKCGERGAHIIWSMGLPEHDLCRRILDSERHRYEIA